MSLVSQQAGFGHTSFTYLRDVLTRLVVNVRVESLAA